MSVIAILIGLAIVGFLAWLVLQIPMPPVFKNIIIGVVVLVLVLWLLQQFGFVGSIPTLRLK